VSGTDRASERFDRLFWPHRRVVVRVARLLARDDAEADDLAQETLLKAFRFADRFDDATDARAWLLTILRNTRIDRLRTAAGRQHPLSLDELPLEPADPRDDAAEPAEWSEPEQLLERIGDDDLVAALRELPEEIRWTLLLVDVEGLEVADAASVLEVPAGTIKSRAHRGRRMLRDRLTPVARRAGWTGRRETERP
jgi:RNA polymerase sigma-70 factor (ECF subfamily)